MIPYRIIIVPSALAMLKGVSDRRIRAKLVERIDALQTSPEQQGKALLGELAGYRSLRAVGQRYRILYRVLAEEVQVLIVAVGLRQEGSHRDIYALAKKLVRLRLLESESDQ